MIWQRSLLFLAAAAFAAGSAAAQVPPPDPQPVQQQPPASPPPAATSSSTQSSPSVTIPLSPPPAAPPASQPATTPPATPEAPAVGPPAKDETTPQSAAGEAAPVAAPPPPKPKPTKAKAKPKPVPVEPLDDELEGTTASGQPGKPPSFRCFVRDVMSFYDRTHVRCYNKARGKIMFFAVDTGQPIAATVLSKALNGIQMGKPVTITFAPTSDLNPSNCDRANCRRLLDIKN